MLGKLYNVKLEAWELQPVILKNLMDFKHYIIKRLRTISW